MRVLAIESTCDETGVAVVESFGNGVKVIKNLVASSAEIHKKYGGVVPEVAAREQIKSIIPLLQESGVTKESIDAVAVSFGPGLMGSLLIGVETAKVVAWAWNKPLIKTNHVSAHLLANWIVDDGQVPELPAIGLVASGGHTDFFILNSTMDWKWIGGTRDDAVGEAFDKVGRIFNLPYPGGPEIDKISNQVSDEKYLNLEKINKLPRPLIHDKTLDMSFSGLKAAVARLGEDADKDLYIRDFSEAVTEVIVSKTRVALETYQPKSLLIGGGVAANTKIRESLKNLSEEFQVPFFVPEIKYCGDNAAMIGAAAILRPSEVNFSEAPDPGMEVV